MTPADRTSAKATVDHAVLRPISDMCGYLPTPRRLIGDIRSIFCDPGYRDSFGRRWAKLFKIPDEVFTKVLDESLSTQRAIELVAPYTKSVAEMVDDLRRQGVRQTMLSEPLVARGTPLSSADLAKEIRAFPDELIGFVRTDPTDVEATLREIRTGVGDYGFRGVTITPFWAGLTAADPQLDEVFKLCSDLNITAWIHTSINRSAGTSMYLEHPRYIDDIAVRYPKLRIVAGHGGWPWVLEMVAVASRHQNVFIDTSSYLPSHMAASGSGWETLIYHMQHVLKDKVVFGSMWGILGRRIDSLVAEAERIGLPDDVLNRWLHTNFGRALGIA